MTVDVPQPLWTPQEPEKSQLAQFQKHIASKYAAEFGIPNKNSTMLINVVDSYDDLWRWSTTQIAPFWYEVFHYLQIKAQNAPKSHEDVMDDSLLMFPRPTWFQNTSVNFAENLLFPSHAIEDPDEHIAIIEASEAGVQQRVTWTELRIRVAQFASALKAAGVTKGDRVGGICLD